MQNLKNQTAPSITLRMAERQDVPKIVELINEEGTRTGAVLSVNSREVEGWISKHSSAVAVDMSGRIVAHQGVFRWPGCGMFELRAAVVKPEFRGNGINFLMKELVINKITERQNPATFISLKNGASNGAGILFALGFEKMPDSEIPKEVLDLDKGQQWTAYKLIKDCLR